MAESRPTVFADFLDVTCSPEQSLYPSVRRFLDSIPEFVLRYEDLDKGNATYDVLSMGHSFGTVKFITDRKWHKIGFSGGVLDFIRTFQRAGCNPWNEFLFLLSEVPHTITRLDAAVDLPLDGPRVLRSLEARYPDDRVALTRKALKVKRMYSARPLDGVQTGTWYVGHKQTGATVTARVYDKVQERIDKSGCPADYWYEQHPCGLTRFELTFRREIGPTLRDVAMPESLFYQYASPTLLKRPDGVPDWVRGDPMGWAPEPVPVGSLTLSEFYRKVDQSPELLRLMSLASDLGPNARAHVVSRVLLLMGAGEDVARAASSAVQRSSGSVSHPVQGVA